MRRENRACVSLTMAPVGRGRGSEKAADLVAATERQPTVGQAARLLNAHMCTPGRPDPPSHRRGHWFEPSIAHALDRRHVLAEGASLVACVVLCGLPRAGLRHPHPLAPSLRSALSFLLSCHHELAAGGWSAFSARFGKEILPNPGWNPGTVTTPTFWMRHWLGAAIRRGSGCGLR
jgi:hypothetical protein